MSIKKKLLLTNLIIFAVMVALSLTYSFFANALLDKFPITGPDKEEFNAISAILTDDVISDDNKAEAVEAYGYKYSIYDTKNNPVKTYGNELKNYELNIRSTTPVVETFADKVLIGVLRNGRVYVAVKVIKRDNAFYTAKNIAVVVMIAFCAIVVFLTCYYQVYTIFPQIGRAHV